MKILALPFFAILVSIFCGSCGEAPQKPNVILLCAVEKEHGEYRFPLQKVLANTSGLDLTLGDGQDISKYGLRYRGMKNVVFPDQIIAFFAAYENKRKSFQLVETAAIVDGHIPSRENISFEKFLESLKP